MLLRSCRRYVSASLFALLMTIFISILELVIVLYVRAAIIKSKLKSASGHRASTYRQSASSLPTDSTTADDTADMSEITMTTHHASPSSPPDAAATPDAARTSEHRVSTVSFDDALPIGPS